MDTQEALWNHRQTNTNTDFIYDRCTRGLHTMSTRETYFHNYLDSSQEVVDCFCFIWDVFSKWGGLLQKCNSLGKNRSENVWEAITAADTRFFFLSEKLHKACVRTVMLHGSETWALNVVDLWRLKRNEAGMLHWKCDVGVHVWQSSCALREKLSIRGIKSSE